MRKMKHCIVYDLSSLPAGMSLKDIKKEFNETGFLIWASGADKNESHKHLTADHKPRIDNYFADADEPENEGVFTHSSVPQEVRPAWRG